MAKTYYCTIEVRGYELDSLGHVNHAMYFSYLEHARWKMLEQEGITLQKFEEWKQWPVVAGIEAQFLRPTYIGESLEIRTTVIEHGRASFVFDHVILRGETAVFRAKVRATLVNERGRPSDLPAHLGKIWEEDVQGGAV